MEKNRLLYISQALLLTLLFLVLGILSVTTATNTPVAQAAPGLDEQGAPQLAVQFGAVAIDNPNAKLSDVLPESLTFNAPGSEQSFTGTLNSQQLAATPVTATASNIDGDDLVTLAIVIENQGEGTTKLSDIQLQAIMPPQPITETSAITLPSSNVQARNGQGDPLVVDPLDGGLFGDGIMLNHPNPQESVLATYDAASGKNVAIVTLDLKVPSTISHGSLLAFSIRISGYSFQEDGDSVVGEFLLTDIRARTEISIASPWIESTIVNTGQIHDETYLDNAALADATPVTIGEIITYEVTVGLPEGTSQESFLKSEMDQGFALVDVLSVTASANVTTDVPGGFAAVKDSVRLIELNPPRPNQGQKFDLYFGAITVGGDSSQADAGGSGSENLPGFVKMRYRVVALNNDINLQTIEPRRRNQYLQWCWTAQHHVVTGNTPDSYIVEPDLEIRQTVVPSQPLPGELFTIELSIAHSPISTAAAHDVELVDLLPPELRYAPGSLRWLEPEVEPDGWRVENVPLDGSGGEGDDYRTNLYVRWNHLPVGERRTVQFQARLTYTHLPPSLTPRTLDVAHSPSIFWSSLPGDDKQALSTYHDLSAERTGDTNDVGALFNTYNDRSDYKFILEVPATAPNRARVEAELAVENLSRSSGAPQPGDRLRYGLTLRNIGSAAARNVMLTNSLDGNLALDDKSIVLSQGSVQQPSISAASAQTTLNAALGTIALTEVVTVEYEALVASPLLLGTSLIANQALIQGDNIVLTVSDDPATVEASDPTVIYTSNSPKLFAFSQSSLHDDADQNERISAGDSVEYKITIVNRGSAAAQNVLFHNNVDANAALIPESLAIISETIVTAIEPGQSSFTVDVGEIGSGESLTLRFRTIVNGLQLSGVQSVENQGVVVAANHPAILTDDPATLRRADPTSVTLIAAPTLHASRSYHLIDDQDGNGRASVGDTIAYSVILQNRGVISATNVVLDEMLDEATTFVEGSLRTNRSDIVLAHSTNMVSKQHTQSLNDDMLPPMRLIIPTLEPAGTFDRDSLYLSYLVELTERSVLSDSIISSQGFVTSTELAVVATHDPARVIPNFATEAFTGLEPQLDVIKQDILLVDSNLDGLLSPASSDGPTDRLLYQLVLQNVGNTSATSVVLEDILDENVRLLPESVRIDRGEVVVGTTADSTDVVVEIGPMRNTYLPSTPESAIVSFEVALTEGEWPEQIENSADVLVLIDNQGTELESQYSVSSDDPKTAQRWDPTITSVTQLPTPLETVNEPDGASHGSTMDVSAPAIYLPLLY